VSAAVRKDVTFYSHTTERQIADEVEEFVPGAFIWESHLVLDGA